MSRQVVIIGAGITGSLLAWRLARAGWGVTVLEARHVGAGSSSRTAAGIRQQFSTPETVLGMRFSVDFYRQFPTLMGSGQEAIHQNGYLFLYAMEEAWTAAQRRVRMQQSLGLTEVQALDQAELCRRFPWVAREAVLGGTFCPTDGFLRPETVYNDALAAAQRLGARLVQGAPVERALHGGDGRLRSVCTPKGDFAADMFVDATNAWSPRLGRVLGGAELPISPLKRYLWFADRAGSLSAEELLAMPLTISPGGAYGRPENGGSLLMGLAHDTAPEPDFSDEDQDRIDAPFFHKSGPDSLGYSAWFMLAEVIPALAEFGGISATTSGFYATTPDHNPFLDLDPQVSNLVRLAGFSGHGAMFGPFTALVGEAICDAGARVTQVEALGHAVPLGSFHIGRDFAGHETQVI